MVKFREFETSSGKKVVCGKNAEQNEDVVKQAGKNEILVHTKEAGSSFCNIKARAGILGSVSKKDIYEAGVFCASYSKDWKHGKKNISVHVFKGKDTYKEKEMKQGTHGVKKFKTIKINKHDIEEFVKGK